MLNNTMWKRVWDGIGMVLLAISAFTVHQPIGLNCSVFAVMCFLFSFQCELRIRDGVDEEAKNA
jgi:hypothetical protein